MLDDTAKNAAFTAPVTVACVLPSNSAHHDPNLLLHVVEMRLVEMVVTLQAADNDARGNPLPLREVTYVLRGE